MNISFEAGKFIICDEKQEFMKNTTNLAILYTNDGVVLKFGDYDMVSAYQRAIPEMLNTIFGGVNMMYFDTLNDNLTPEILSKCAKKFAEAVDGSVNCSGTVVKRMNEVSAELIEIINSQKEVTI